MKDNRGIEQINRTLKSSINSTDKSSISTTVSSENNNRKETSQLNVNNGEFDDGVRSMVLWRYTRITSSLPEQTSAMFYMVCDLGWYGTRLAE